MKLIAKIRLLYRVFIFFAVSNNVFLLYSSSLFCFGICSAVCPGWYRFDTESTEPFLELVYG